MISLLTIFILYPFCIAICDAYMDVVNFHWEQSVFKHMAKMGIISDKWWNQNISWKNKYVDGNETKGRKKIHFWLPTRHIDYANHGDTYWKWEWRATLINYPVQLTDGWHFFKMIKYLLIFILPAHALYIYVNHHPYSYGIQFAKETWVLLMAVFIMGFVYNKTFQLFYHTIFRRK